MKTLNDVVQDKERIDVEILILGCVCRVDFDIEEVHESEILHTDRSPRYSQLLQVF